MKKNKKDGKLLSWREVFGLTKRAYALIYRRCPAMVLSRIICIIFDSLTPYVGIYLSALLINELAGGRNESVLINLVLAILGTAAGIALIASFLYKWRDVKCAGMYFREKQIFSEKNMAMDFTDADSAETHAMLTTIEMNNNSGGWGLNRVYGNVENMLSALISLLGAVSLTVTLFTSKVPDGGGYTVLNNPLFMIAIVAVMLVITYAAPMLSNKAGSYHARNSRTHNQANQLFGFFGWLGYNSAYAADVRIYRQDLICDKHNADKTGTFNSQGTFAKLAKGPVGLYQAAASAVSVLLTGVVYLFVCMKALSGAFGIGSVTQYIASITKLSESLSSFIRTAGDMRNNASFLKLVFEYLDIPSNMYQGSLTVEKRNDRDYEVEFRDVSFKYPGSESYALRHVDMKFKIGERLAVVGQNGSGKTTFIKLLCRLYDPTEGEILLNGINIRKYDYAEYMSIFSVVFQDFKLFAFTLGENIGAGINYGRERAEACLKNAGFGARLGELTQGMDTYLYKDLCKDGVDISGGEAQKIALARALYKDAPFIVLDEPTAALDPVAEAEVYSNFNSIVGDKTAVYISHRLSSCRFCDNIVVFDKGQIVQHGTHDGLVSDQTGKYSELWSAQAKYYTKKA